MAWVAALTGGFTISSEEGTNNILEMNGQMNSWDMDLNAQAGLLGNVAGESGFNPWRWGMRLVPPYDEFVDPSNGYGLFQWTPSTNYINSNNEDLPGYGPNMSVTEITPGATPEDGWAQMQFWYDLCSDPNAGVWVTNCWPYYWSDDPNVALPGWAMTTDQYIYWRTYADGVIATYGSNGEVTFDDFLNCPDVHAATFMFMACFEKPAWPLSQPDREEAADACYEIISGGTPPNPPGTLTSKSNWIYYLKLL